MWLNLILRSVFFAVSLQQACSATQLANSMGRILLGNLIVTQLVSKFPAFMVPEGSLPFITVIISKHHWNPSRTKRIQSTASKPISTKFILNPILPHMHSLPRDLFMRSVQCGSILCEVVFMKTSHNLRQVLKNVCDSCWIFGESHYFKLCD
jgi:hypothetical protein